MADMVEIAKEVEMGRDPSKSLAPVNKSGYDGTGIGIYVNRVETIETE